MYVRSTEAPNKAWSDLMGLGIKQPEAAAIRRLTIRRFPEQQAKENEMIVAYNEEEKRMGGWEARGKGG